MMRIAVAGEKALKPDHVRGARRADQHGAGRAALEQGHPPKDERPHDALAEIGFGDQERTQAFGRDQQRLDVALRRSVDKRARVESWPTSARNWPAPCSTIGVTMAEAVALGDRDLALEHDEHARADLSRFNSFSPSAYLRSDP